MIDKIATLAELGKFVDLHKIDYYQIQDLTPSSTIESFEYLGRCNATAILLVRFAGNNVTIKRVCVLT